MRELSLNAGVPRLALGVDRCFIRSEGVFAVGDPCRVIREIAE